MKKPYVPVIAIVLAIGTAMPCILCAPLNVMAGKTQTAPSADVKPETEAAAKPSGPPSIHHILLEVSNMQASIAFYRDMFGFTPKSIGANFTTLEGANVDIYLSTSPWRWKAPRGKNERLGLGMYPHLEMANVHEAVARLKKAGYIIVQEPQEYNWGTEAFVADPDGYTWALITLPKKQ